MQSEIKKIAVAGATGRVGHHVVEVLTERGYDVVAMSRATGVDVVTGAGLEGALIGVDAIIDTATGPSPEQQAATAFFTAAADNLQRTGAAAGVQRIVVVSIIGIDHLTAGYNVAKLAHERAALSGPVPVRILRAAQFHEFVAQLMDWGSQGDVAYVPKMRTQLVAARTVAEALVDLAVAPDEVWAGSSATAPIGEIAGPRAESLVDMAIMRADRRGNHVKVEAVSDSANPDSELMEDGVLLPGQHATLAGPSFGEWLDAST